jgi:hypothetical protein
LEEQTAQGGHILLEIVKKDGLYFPYAAGGTGSGGEQIFIVRAPLGEITKSHIVRAAALKNCKGIGCPFIGRGHDGCKEPVVFGNPLAFLLFGNEIFLQHGVKPLFKGRVKKMSARRESVFIHDRAALLDDLSGGCVGHKKIVF